MRGRALLIIAALVTLRAGTAGAFDPSLADALLNADPAVRVPAYDRAAALSNPDKINLAPFISQHLEDPELGERAAMALTQLGDVGVSYLDRHARSSEPGAEYATMGLLLKEGAGQAAVAAILRNGDEPAVMRTLAVIEASTVLPPVVAAEVQRLADDTNLHFAKAARSAIDAVAKANEKASGGDSGSLAPENAHLGGAAGTGSKEATDEALKKLIATIQSAGSAGRQALDNALAAGSIDKAAYDQILALLGAAPTEQPSSAPAQEGMKTWQPDTSKYKTRQPASDAFNKH